MRIAETTPYRLTSAAVTYSWRAHAPYNVTIGLAFAWVGGPLLALCWTLVLYAMDFGLQRAYRRLTLKVAHAESDHGLTRLSGLALAKGLAWYSVPSAHTVLNHSVTGMAFAAMLALGLTALSVSTARNSRLVYFSMVALPVLFLPLCVVSAWVSPRAPERCARPLCWRSSSG
jgi:hypothetical protein